MSPLAQSILIDWKLVRSPPATTAMVVLKKSLVTKAKQPPPQKRKRSSPPPSFSLLPDEIFLNCLSRSSKADYRSLSLVSKTIRSLISSPELYTVRSQIGKTEPFLYICQELPSYDRWYTLDQSLLTSTNGGWTKDEHSLLPIRRPTSSTPPPSKSITLSVGFEIYQMGGTINDQRPSSAVRVLDCRTHTWRDAPDMTVARKRADSAFIDGKIYVVGGNKEPMNWGEVFDLKSQTWKPLPSLSDDAQAHLHLRRGELYATSKHQKYAYDPKQGRWNLCLYPPQLKSGSWCLIEKVKFCVSGHELMWYDSERGSWFDVKGLNDLYIKLSSHTRTTIHNHDGKILLLWEDQRLLEFPMPAGRRMQKHKHVCKNKRIWCAVIKLEKRIGFSGLETWGEILRLNPVLTLPDSYKLLNCITL